VVLTQQRQDLLLQLFVGVPVWFMDLSVELRTEYICFQALFLTSSFFLSFLNAEGLGILKDFPHSAFNNIERKVIKTEPEDTR